MAANLAAARPARLLALLLLAGAALAALPPAAASCHFCLAPDCPGV